MYTEKHIAHFGTFHFTSRLFSLNNVIYTLTPCTTTPSLTGTEVTRRVNNVLVVNTIPLQNIVTPGDHALRHNDTLSDAL